MYLTRMFALVLLMQVLGAFLSVADIESMTIWYVLVKISFEHVLRYDFWALLLQTALAMYLGSKKD